MRDVGQCGNVLVEKSREKKSLLCEYVFLNSHALGALNSIYHQIPPIQQKKKKQCVLHLRFSCTLCNTTFFLRHPSNACSSWIEMKPMWPWRRHVSAIAAAGCAQGLSDGRRLSSKIQKSSLETICAWTKKKKINKKSWEALIALV